MLCLSRGVEEEVYIDGKRIILTILAIQRGKVRLGFTAAEDIQIHRAEVYRAIERDIRNQGRAPDSESPTQ